MALTQGLLDQYWRRYNQRRALTGLPSSYQEMRGMLDPMLESAANKDLQEARLRADNSYRERALTMQEQAQKDAESAAAISGIAQTGGMLASAGLGYKALTNQAANTDMMRQYLLGAGGSPKIPTAGMLGAGSGGSPIATGVGSGVVPMANASPYSAAPALSYGAGGEVGAGLASTAYAGMSPAVGLGLAGAAYGAQVGLMGPIIDKYIGEKMNLPYTAKAAKYVGPLVGLTVAPVEFVFNEAKDFIDKIW